jgi:hypothetical protein
MTVSVIPEDGGPEYRLQTLGFVYDIRQLDTTGAGWTLPVFGTSFLSPRPTGTLINGVFDIGAVVDRGEWTARTGTNAVGEGLYGVSMRFYNQFRVEDQIEPQGVYLGVDFTSPSPVENLTSTVGALGSASAWTEARWRDLRWTDKAYDALSGVGGFKVKVNSNEVAFVHNVAPDPAYEPYAAYIHQTTSTPLPQISKVTVEDLPAGESSISVRVVDRATNESSARTVKAYVDYDTPSVTIKKPAANERVTAKPGFSVVTNDLAGVARVKYYVDDVLVGTVTSSPFSLKPDLSGFANGTHELKVVVEDRLAGIVGTRIKHDATATRSFVLDKTAPTISSVSGAPSPFYPRKRDGYKDWFKVKFTTSEAGTAKLVVKNSNGTTVRTLTKAVGAGAKSISWSGYQSDKVVRSGSFTCKLYVTDAAGNTRTVSARRVSIKFYEVVRVSSSSVRIISR